MNTDVIYVRALNDTDDLYRAGLFNYCAVYHRTEHYFDNLSDLIEFIQKTIRDLENVPRYKNPLYPVRIRSGCYELLPTFGTD